MTALEKLKKEATRNFLNNVLIVDDKISFDAIKEPGKLTTPGEFGDIPIDVSDKSTSFGKSTLDAKKLISCFSSENIHCTPYLYDTEFPYLLAQKSDIVILDWDLDGKKETILNILNKILQDNLLKMWYIIIYTSCDLDEVINNLRENNFSSKLKLINEEGYTLNYRLETNSHISGRIDVIKKCDETELSKKVIEGFNNFSGGFMNSIALKAVTAVRKRAYDLLGTYHNALDNAIITHYINLLLNKDVCAQAKYNLLHYALSLIISDIGDIIKEDFASEIYLVDSIDELLNDKKTLYIGSTEYKTKANKAIGELIKTANFSEDNLENFLSDSFENIKYDDVKKKALSLSADNRYEKELAYVDCTKKCFNKECNHELKFGSIVKRGEKEYLLCIQPLCDCERLKKDTAFLFIKLSKDSKKFSFVIRDEDDFKYLRVSAELSKTFVSEMFSPLIETKNVQSVSNIFKNKKGEEFKWICDLKTEYVQKIIQEISTTYNRIGMDQFEWLRKKSN